MSQEVLGGPAPAGAPPPASPFPEQLQALQSVVIRFHGRPFVALGWLRLDRPAGRFDLTGMTPAGMTLFTLSDTGAVTDASFSLPLPGEQSAWAAGMAADVRRVFVEAVARPGDEAAWRGAGWRVTRREGGRVVAELDYDGADGRLARARWYENGRRVGETRFDDYRPAGGQAMPFHVLHTQSRWGYTLEIRCKEIQRAGGAAP